MGIENFIAFTVVSPFQAIVDYEVQNGIPKDWINFAISRSGPSGAWQRIERGEIPLDDAFFDAFRADLHDPRAWEEYHRVFKHRRRRRSGSGSTGASGSAEDETLAAAAPEDADAATIPPLPTIDSTPLFCTMMTISRAPDPYMFPALRYLRTHTPFLLGALSNTITFPPSHPFSRPPDDNPRKDLRAQFDVFVASSE
ncbi:MAG: hypothetical protein LQ340_005606, partial [Diploschistes diacapsis]